MQVRADPGTVLKLRCLFLKMRSLLEVPLLRMGQARSPSLAVTSRVYSSALVAFSCRLLQASTSATRKLSPAVHFSIYMTVQCAPLFPHPHQKVIRARYGDRRPSPPVLAQVVPETVGALLDQMVVLRSQRMRALPARIERNALREHAQPQQRAQLAALARRIAAFAEGMRAMEKCALGAHAYLFNGLT